MSKAHPQQWEIHDEDHRPSAEAVAALAAFPTTQIADCGGPVAVVGPGITHRAGVSAPPSQRTRKRAVSSARAG